MNTQDWYRRALGVVQPGPGTPAQHAPQYPQAYAQQLPAGYAPPPGYQLVPVSNGNGAQTISWEQLHGGQQVPNVDTSTIPRGAVTPENFLEMAKFWKGGVGNKVALDCPACGGVLFRRFVGNMEARPLCENCGYNGAFVQGQGAVA